MTKHRTHPQVKHAARKLRRAQTPMERRLWAQIRRKKLDGLRFRRQHPIGRFIVDFYCPSQGLIIELDGPSHDFQAEYDDSRTAWLESQGYRMLRFTNDDVQHNLAGVLEHIRAVAANEAD